MSICPFGGDGALNLKKNNSTTLSHFASRLFDVINMINRIHQEQKRSEHLRKSNYLSISHSQRFVCQIGIAFWLYTKLFRMFYSSSGHNTESIRCGTEESPAISIQWRESAIFIAFSVLFLSHSQAFSFIRLHAFQDWWK